jgi:murein DD-endopeptidase MepM/ murein hydrolase activator NlpD
MLAILSACATTQGTTPAEKRAAIVGMKNETLADLYTVRPHARAEIAAAPGYAVFSNANVNIIFASFSGGYGVVDAKSGRQTYMKMGEAGIGLS